MPYEDNSNSFLFGLNQFTSPPADASTPRASNGRSDNMLASLEAFTSDDVGGGSNINEGMAAQAPNFADQLALWTNANFSFDGPTGHALLGDEEKEKEEAEHNRRRDDENRRNEDERERERSSRNAAASSRASNALRGKARDIDHTQPESSNYNASSQATASPAPQLHQQGPYYPGTSAYQNTARPPPSSQAGGSNPLFPFVNNFGGMSQPQQQQQGISGSAPGGMGSLDMTSALALQHLLASNPLALASLSQLAGLSNPQIQNQLAGLANNGAGMFGMQQQSQSLGNMPANAGQWLAAQSQNASRTGGFSGPSPQPGGWPSQMPQLGASPSVAPTVNGTAHRAGKSHSKDDKDADRSGTHSVEMGASDSESGVAAKKKRTSTSEGKKAQTGENDDDDDILSRLEDIEKRYEIPPLSLIDTGNPEADAEANRHAIEEDKRRRNTAASARFRIKKKQREAALEIAAKELHQRLADLESENERLRTENGWLKSLITVRPDQAVPGGFDQNNAFSNAAAAMAVRASTSSGPSASNPTNRPTASTLSSNPAPPSLADHTTHLPNAETPDRHTGLHPRGVGTKSIAKHDSDNPPKSAANGKRDREN